MHVAVTRPMPQGLLFAKDLEERFGDRVQPICSPVMKIVPLPVSIDFNEFDGVVFTSQNGVAAFERIGGPAEMTAYCVGARTARAAEGLGLKAVSAEGDIEALNILLRERAADQRLLHISGKHVAGEVAGNVVRVAAYDQRPVPLSTDLRTALSRPEKLIVPLFSPNAAKWFQAALPDEISAGLLAVCLSDAVVEHLDSQKFTETATCEIPNLDAMMREIGTILESYGA